MHSWFSMIFPDRVRPGSVRIVAAAAGLLLAAGVSSAWAQGVLPAGAPGAKTEVSLPVVEGKTIDGKPFKLSMLKGKVVLVMFWSTGCAVCRDKMPELRENYAGWNGKPFELVAVNTDVQKNDFMEYERIVTSTVPANQRFIQLWAGESGYRDNIGNLQRLPDAFLIDKAGKLVERYMGRIPPETWDRIADLL
jgi:thiol-disulfide isomerase/thioredoxin